MASSTEPRGIPILVKDGGNLRPDKEALNAIFMKDKLQGKKISIISIAGAFRKGKSFILNFLLRYLRVRGHTTSNWIGRSTESLKGFNWTGGMDACTTGLLIWSEVFYVKKDKEEIAVFLMDTQGLYDNDTEGNVNALVFSLSTLISSVQMFNLSQQIQENDLAFLQLFTEYAAASGQKKMQGYKDPKTDEGPPFQNLIFLIRDWQNPYQCEYGFIGGQKYLHKVLDKKCEKPELESVRRHMKSSFENLECCLFPYPGKKVAVVTNEGNKFTGSLSDMDDDFRDNVRRFVEGVLFPDKLIIKTINGQPVTNISLLDYILKCCEYVSSGNLPTVMNLTETLASATNMEAQRNCCEEYANNMKRRLLKGEFMEKQALESLHKEEYDKAMEMFQQKTPFGPESARSKHRDYLKDMIEKEFQNIRQRNEGTKIESEKIGLGLVEQRIGEYEKMMKQVIEKASLRPEKLQDRHLQCKADVIKSCKKEFQGKKIKLSKNYEDQLSDNIVKAYDKARRNNSRKRKVEIEKDDTVKQIMKLRIDAEALYSTEMEKLIDDLRFEPMLPEAHQRLKRSAIDDFQRKALESISVQIPPSKIKLEKTILDQQLEEEFVRFGQKNEANKNIMRKILEKRRNDIYNQYDEHFRKRLRNGYVKPQALEDDHILLKKLIHNSISSHSEEEKTDPMFREHERIAELKLEEKYKGKLAWNKRNRTLFQIVFG